MIFRLQLVLEIDTKHTEPRILNQRILDVTPKNVTSLEPVIMKNPGRGPDKQPRHRSANRKEHPHETSTSFSMFTGIPQ